MSIATLTATDLTKSYGGSVVLDGLSLVVPPGARIGVVAPNGTGKSTLLRLLAREELADSGSVRLDPPEATVGHITQELERGPETVGALLARRTGVAGANAMLDLAATALADARPGSDEVYAEALERYLALGAADFEARRDQMLGSVGLSAALLDQPTSTLSGGQAARLALASILLTRYDVLCLDEPTNDLDFKGLEQLEQFLAGLEVGVVIVSHDRDFLSRTITSVLEIDEHTHRGRFFDGGWTAFGEQRETARRHARERYDDYVRRRTDLEQRAQREREWSQQGVAKVRRSGEPDKFVRHFRRASSEQLAGKAKRTERSLGRLEQVDKPWEGWELRFDIATAARSGDVVARLDGAVVRRDGFVLGPVDLEIAWAERIAILGGNGAGKSTLLGALLGRVPLERGTRVAGPGVVFGELDQARSEFADAPDLVTGLQAATGATVSETRSLLAKFDLDAQDVDRPVASLSPGERTRAAMALLMGRGANCLVLDEPTNHLDLPAIEQLEAGLAGWNATLLLVTHDRAFLDAVAIDRRLEVVDGRVVQLDA